ncbi:MAG TPA: hypothetical protein VM870_08590, partial [Pyrinomonadaceae bacterium]|nr:hypothetical protein [Pyrinomonadaceae bacterium]
MRPSHCFRVLPLLVCCSLYPAFALAAPESLTPIPLAALKEQARKRQGEPARVALAAKDAEIFRGAEPLNYLGASEPPNYLRALAVLPNAVKPSSELLSAALYAGQLEPEVKMAMGLRMAQLNNSPYVAAHMGRLLRASPRGQKLLAQLEAADAKAWAPPDALALEYADSLTRNVNGVSDAAFQKVSAVYNDSQLVEMTMTVSFFNYFTRMAEALRLPVESWAFDAPQGSPAPNRFAPPPARVALIS